MGNSQKLDGGAMFGNTPKALWTRWTEVDDRNRIDLCCRALLVETANRKILLETGIGAYMEPKLRDRFGVQESHHVLLESLKELGLEHQDIDTVILSHLHFDHAGGLLSAFQQNDEPQLLFPKATFVVGQEAWDRANNPHFRDRASFIPGLQQKLEGSGRLNIVTEKDVLQIDNLEIRFIQSHGHTPGMLCSDLRFPNGRLVFAADLIPGTPWVHLPITMGYDRFPELLINEKQSLLQSLNEDRGQLFFTHDPQTCCSQISFNLEKKKFLVENPKPNLIRDVF